MDNLESGAVENEKVTTKTAETKDGKIVETVVTNKDTGEIKSHTVNGKDVEKKEEAPKQLHYQRGNFEEILIRQNNMILAQLKEMNYYMSYLEKSKEEDNG